MKTLSIFMILSLLGASVTASAAEPASAKPAAAKPADSKHAGAKPADDHVALDTTQITGNRELPRVLYVVPWKRADLGELDGKPTKSLLDEVLAPVDRDVFRRQNSYHDALQPDTAASGKADAAGGER